MVRSVLEHCHAGSLPTYVRKTSTIAGVGMIINTTAAAHPSHRMVTPPAHETNAHDGEGFELNEFQSLRGSRNSHFEERTIVRLEATTPIA